MPGREERAAGVLGAPAAFMTPQMAVSLKLGGPFWGVLIIRALLLGVYIRGPSFLAIPRYLLAETTTPLEIQVPGGWGGRANPKPARLQSWAVVKIRTAQ